MDLTPHVLKGMCVVLASERWNVTTSSLSFFSKWGHRRKMALSSTCNTTLWEDAELSKCHWETEEAGTSLGSRQQCSRLLLYPEIHFSWHWARTERWGKNNFFLKKKNPQNKTKKYLNKANQQTPPQTVPKRVLTEAVRCLSGIDVYSDYSDYFEDQFPWYNSVFMSHLSGSVPLKIQLH